LRINQRWEKTQHQIPSIKPCGGLELRWADFRVLFDIDEARRTVTVQAIGEKRETNC
jgi:mRNA-degrading endonuclease RelE of RelBE toxin-antitoxin system